MMADIRRRHNADGSVGYQVRYIDKSKKSGFGYRTFFRAKDANQFKARMELEEQAGLGALPKLTVPDAVEKWLDICEKEGTDGNDPVSPYTLENYHYYARFMTGYAWPCSIAELKPPHIVDYRSWLIAECPSRYVARKALTYFTGLLNEMVIRGLATANAALGVTIKQASRYDEPVEIPTLDDIAALLTAADALANSSNAQIANAWRRYRPMLYLACDTGARPQEYLVAANYAFNDNAFEVDRALAGNGREISVTKTPSGRRSISLTPETYDLVRHYADNHALPNKHDLIFPVESGRWQERRNWTRSCFDVACQHAGLVDTVHDDETGEARDRVRYTPYDLRHFFASMLIEHVPNLKKIQKAMGHRKIETTFNVYGHLIERRQEDEREFTANDPGVVGWVKNLVA